MCDVTDPQVLCLSVFVVGVWKVGTSLFFGHLVTGVIRDMFNTPTVSVNHVWGSQWSSTVNPLYPILFPLTNITITFVQTDLTVCALEKKLPSNHCNREKRQKAFRENHRKRDLSPRTGRPAAGVECTDNEGSELREEISNQLVPGLVTFCNSNFTEQIRFWAGRDWNSHSPGRKWLSVSSG